MEGVKDKDIDKDWVLVEESDAMQRYVKREYPESYHEEIKKYRTPTKIIKDGDYIIVVSVTREDWAGINIYHKEDFLIKEMDGKTVFIRNPMRASRLLNTVGTDVNEEYFMKMSSYGYIEHEEINKYLDVSNHEKLPLVKAINF